MNPVDIKIETIGGNCPVQAEGTIDGKKFYFRSRHNTWSVGIGDHPIGNPDWYYDEDYGEGPFEAGWMLEEVAIKMINKAARFYSEQKDKES